MDDNKFIDASFSEVNKENKQEIFSISQVAKILGETSSTLRTWCDKHETILNISKNGRNRIFRKEDIETLKKIQDFVRNKGYSHELVSEHYKKGKEEILDTLSIKSEDPLMLQTISTLIAKDINNELASTLNGFMEGIKEREEITRKENQKQIDELKSTIESLTEKIDNQIQYIDKRELEAKQRDDELMSFMRAKMEQRHSENESNNKPEKVGFFKKLFG